MVMRAVFVRSRFTPAVNGWQIAALISPFACGMCKLEHV
jgi:hypothetical protein